MRVPQPSAWPRTSVLSSTLPALHGRSVLRAGLTHEVWSSPVSETQRPPRGLRKLSHGPTPRV